MKPANIRMTAGPGAVFILETVCLSIVNLFPSLDCHLGWPARLPFEYGIESNSSLISFLFLTGNDMACDDMRESTSKTFWVSLMVNCWPICKLGSTCHAEMYVNSGQNDSGKVNVPRPIQRTSNRKRNLKKYLSFANYCSNKHNEFIQPSLSQRSSLSRKR